jgi:hypothetical protein
LRRAAIHRLRRAAIHRLPHLWGRRRNAGNAPLNYLIRHGALRLFLLLLLIPIAHIRSALDLRNHQILRYLPGRLLCFPHQPLIGKPLDGVFHLQNVH